MRSTTTAIQQPSMSPANETFAPFVPHNNHASYPRGALSADDDDDVLLTTEQLAALRNVPPSRVNKERLTGDGPPFIKDGHLVRYRRGDYPAWVAAKQRFNSTSEAEAA